MSIRDQPVSSRESTSTEFLGTGNTAGDSQYFSYQCSHSIQVCIYKLTNYLRSTPVLANYIVQSPELTVDLALRAALQEH